MCLGRTVQIHAKKTGFLFSTDVTVLSTDNTKSREVERIANVMDLFIVICMLLTNVYVSNMRLLLQFINKVDLPTLGNPKIPHLNPILFGMKF